MVGLHAKTLPDVEDRYKSGQFGRKVFLARGCALAAMPAYLLCATAMMLGGPETALRKPKFYADD